MTMHEWIVVTAGGGCAACVAFLVLQIIGQMQAFRQASAREMIITDTSSGLLRSFMPLARSLGAGLRSTLSRGKSTGVYPALLDFLGRKLSAAGNPQGLNPDEYVGFGVILAGIGGAFGVFSFMILEEMARFNVYVYFVGGALLAVFWWHSRLSRRQAERQMSIRKSLPFCLDLLTLATEAGLDFTSAVSRLVKKIGGTPLGQEFSLMLHEIQLGKTRSQALRDFANRVNVEEVGTVVASLIQAEELGASLGPILRIQASQQRERRSQRAEEQAMKAPVKMLFPLTVFIFPTVLLMIFGTIALKFF